jgi:hypothetical protein
MNSEGDMLLIMGVHESVVDQWLAIGWKVIDMESAPGIVSIQWAGHAEQTGQALTLSVTPLG